MFKFTKQIWFNAYRVSSVCCRIQQVLKVINEIIVSNFYYTSNRKQLMDHHLLWLQLFYDFDSISCKNFFSDNISTNYIISSFILNNNIFFQAMQKIPELILSAMFSQQPPFDKKNLQPSLMKNLPQSSSRSQKYTQNIKWIQYEQ